jgi:hypothetical protein
VFTRRLAVMAEKIVAGRNEKLFNAHNVASGIRTLGATAARLRRRFASLVMQSFPTPPLIALMPVKVLRIAS